MQLKLSEVAACFGVDENVVQRWIQEKHLPVQMANSQFRFNRAEVAEWATLNHVPIPPALLTLRNGELVSSEFASSLEIGGVHARVPGADMATVLKNVVAKLSHFNAQEQANLESLLISREKIGSTAIGDGIAIPHPRCPVSLTDGKSISMLCYLEQPLDLQAPDKKPVHALFLVLTPNVRRHSLLIAEIALALQDKDFRASLQRQAPEAEILSHAKRIGKKLVGDAAGRKLAVTGAQG